MSPVPLLVNLLVINTFAFVFILCVLYPRISKIKNKGQVSIRLGYPQNEHIIFYFRLLFPQFLSISSFFTTKVLETARIPFSLS